MLITTSLSNPLGTSLLRTSSDSLLTIEEPRLGLGKDVAALYASAQQVSGELTATLWDTHASTCQLPAWQRQALQPASCSINIVTFDAGRLLDEATRADEQSKLFPMLDTALLFNDAPILLASKPASPASVLDAYPLLAYLQERALKVNGSLVVGEGHAAELRELIATAEPTPSTLVMAGTMAHVAECLVCESIMVQGLQDVSQQEAVSAFMALTSMAVCLPSRAGVFNSILIKPSELESVFEFANGVAWQQLRSPSKGCKKANRRWKDKQQAPTSFFEAAIPINEGEKYSWREVLRCLVQLGVATVLPPAGSGLTQYQISPVLFKHYGKRRKETRTSGYDMHVILGGHAVSSSSLNLLLFDALLRACCTGSGRGRQRAQLLHLDFLTREASLVLDGIRLLLSSTSNHLAIQSNRQRVTFAEVHDAIAPYLRTVESNVFNNIDLELQPSSSRYKGSADAGFEDSFGSFSPHSSLSERCQSAHNGWAF